MQADVARIVTADGLALFSELYGEYPHSSLSVVEADFPDGMEYDGIYYLGESYYRQYKGEPLSYLVAIASHETAHQWFYGIVGNDPAIEPWLDETLATYSELLYYERYFPELVDGWWNFRVESYSPDGWVNDTIYDHGSFRLYVNAVYLRGAQFLRDLRGEIGEEKFFGFLREYTVQGGEKSPGDISSTGFFFHLLSEHTDQDLSLLITDYFKNLTP
jgi:aminopeptidase N